MGVVGEIHYATTPSRESYTGKKSFNEDGPTTLLLLLLLLHLCMLQHNSPYPRRLRRWEFSSTNCDVLQRWFGGFIITYDECIEQ